MVLFQHHKALQAWGLAARTVDAVHHVPPLLLLHKQHVEHLQCIANEPSVKSCITALVSASYRDATLSFCVNIAATHISSAPHLYLTDATVVRGIGPRPPVELDLQATLLDKV